MIGMANQFRDGRSIRVEVTNNIDTTLNSFNNMILEAANTAIGKTEYIKKHRAVPWWNEECSKAMKACNAALRKYKRKKRNKILFKKHWTQVRLITNRSKRDSWLKYVQSITAVPPFLLYGKKLRE
ncbi:hypothetical protein JTB14_036129 [Gonioctena quinquepunctata]|nr:hypothetical protein JTB14_036129 [Gonioctena quinquepunctata]